MSFHILSFTVLNSGYVLQLILFFKCFLSGTIESLEAALKALSYVDTRERLGFPLFFTKQNLGHFSITFLCPKPEMEAWKRVFHTGEQQVDMIMK